MIDKIPDLFIEVKFLETPLDKRSEWLRSKEEILRAHCLDPEFNLQTQPAVDILFTEIPDELQQSHALEITTESPKEDEIFGMLAIHDSDEEVELKIYEQTVQNPPKARNLFYSTLSLSLGKVIRSGSMCTVISTFAMGSSGGCLFDENLKSFGISLGSYYDNPGHEQSTQSINFYDVYLGDNDKDPKSRNRNIVLTFSHPAVQLMLDALTAESQSELEKEFESEKECEKTQNEDEGQGVSKKRKKDSDNLKGKKNKKAHRTNDK